MSCCVLILRYEHCILCLCFYSCFCVCISAAAAAAASAAAAAGVIRGLDGAGKTTFVRRLNGGDVESVAPTLGFSIYTFSLRG